MQFVSDLHVHTIASTHAFSTVTENAAQAARVGLKLMAVSDHAMTMPDAPHLWHHFNLEVIPRYLNGVFIVRGIEADIMDYEGDLDTDEELLSSLDWAIASFHKPSCLPGTELQHTESYIRVLENKGISCLGHTDDTRYPYEVRTVCRACHDLGKAMELNVARITLKESVPRRAKVSRKFYRNMLSICAEEKTNIIVNSDAHFWSAVGAFDEAASLIEEVGFPHELVLNLDEDRIKNYIVNQRGRNIFQ
ncbi:MAG: phosphatase [Firmicutes bacterium]|nr:phosphatase [[Eubacterium] siraeum]MCM1487115.1 phosphatase [Bacillota bacterium]